MWLEFLKMEIMIQINYEPLAKKSGFESAEPGFSSVCVILSFFRVILAVHIFEFFQLRSGLV